MRGTEVDGCALGYLGERTLLQRPPVILSSTVILGLWCPLFYMVYGHCLPVPPIIPMFQLPCFRGGAGPADKDDEAFLHSAHGHLTVQTSLCYAGSFKSTTHVEQFISPKPIDFEHCFLVHPLLDVAKRRRIAR